MMSRTDWIIAQNQSYIANNYHPLPVVFATANGVWYTDVEGNKYLDMLAGYSAANHGHCHHRIMTVMLGQLKKLVVAPRAVYNDQLGEFGRVITEFCGMQKILPANGGAESVETAIKLVRKWGYLNKAIQPGNAEIIVCRNNFHGRTTTIVGFSSEEQYRQNFGPFAPGFRVVDFGNPDYLGRAITKNTVAFLVEPIQGEGGIIVPPYGYFKEVEKICRRNKVLLALDEIQTGFGRTGSDFAFQHEGIRPDVLIIGKSLGGGLAVSGVLANDEVMGVIKPGDHGSTFGGNPLACAVAIEAIKIIRDERLSEKSAMYGKYFISRLKQIKSPLVAEVRGRGLMIGVQLKIKARLFCEAMLKERILCKETHDYVVRFTPPLVISREDIDWALERIRKVLARLEEQR